MASRARGMIERAVWWRRAWGLDLVALADTTPSLVAAASAMDEGSVVAAIGSRAGIDIKVMLERGGEGIITAPSR